MLVNKIFRIFSSSASKQASLFDTLNFPPFVRKIFDSKSYVQPTPIQAESWPLALQGKDIIGC